jgi:oligoendopeptidase F
MTQEIIKWDLGDFYENINDSQIELDMKTIENEAKDFVFQTKGKLNEPGLDSQKLKNYLESYEKLAEKLAYLSRFARLSYSTNSLDDKVKAFLSKIEEFGTKIQETILFFQLELNTIDESKFKIFIEDKLLSNYHHFLKITRKRKIHQLSEKEEQIILMKDLVGCNGFSKLYAEITSGYTFPFEKDGETKILTSSELIAHMFGENRELRKKAMLMFVDKHREDELVLTHIFNNIIKDFDLETKKRNYQQPIDQFNLRHETKGEVVQALERATTQSYNIVEKYYNVKKKMLNLEELHIYDIYAPIGKISREYSYEEAISLVVSAAEKFDAEFAEIIKDMVNNGHIDVTPRKGKRGGAFCSYGKIKHLPFVFVNFTGNIRSVLTLAHELGHAVHMFYSLKTQTFLNVHSTLPMAEIASVFMEIMTFDYLLKQDFTKEEQITLLGTHLEDNFATSHRQNAFHRFELQIHELMEKQLPTTKDYTEIYTREIQKMFGNSIVDIEKEYTHYCFVVSHFISVPFYVYAYNLSNMMVIAMYQLYIEKGKDYFVGKYKEMLATGSAKTPDEMVAVFGINLEDTTFWQKGTKYLQSKVEELEKLV